MKIGIVIERIEPWRGGAEISTMQVARHLMRRGCEVTVFTASRGASIPGLRIHHVPVRSPWRGQRTVRFVRQVEALLRSRPLDLVHAITPVPSADIYQPRGGLVAETIRRNLAVRSSGRSWGLKRFTTILNRRQRAVARLERLLLRRHPPPMVLAVSRYVASQLEHLYGLTEPTVRVVFNGVEIEAVSQQEREEDRRCIRAQYHLEAGDCVLLFVAHNFKLKGCASLIRAVSRLGESPLPLRALIVGRDNPIRFQRLAEREGIGQRIIFTGSTPRVRSLYHAADMLVHPTYYDPCSRVVLEALCAGLPCITTRFNGAAEVLENGRHGYVIDSPQDIDALADCIRRLADPEHHAYCSAEASRLQPRLSMDRQVDEILEAYHERLHERIAACQT